MNPLEWDLVVTIDNERIPVRSHWDEDGFVVTQLEEEEEEEGAGQGAGPEGGRMVVRTDWTVGEPVMTADINGKDVTVQVC